MVGFTLKNDNFKVKVTGHVVIVEDAIVFRIDGYGDSGSVVGEGIPVFLELYEGRLRLIVYPDINEEEPQIIDLEAAKETNRLRDS